MDFVMQEQMTVTRIQPHFHCDLNIALDPCVQLTIRSIHGLCVDSLTETEKEHAAKGIACGYLYREDNMLYTKILVNQLKDDEKIFDISKKFGIGDFEQEAQSAAAQIADLIRKNVPSHLFLDWKFANELAALPILNDLVEILIEKGVLTPPKEELGAEGCWMSVEK